MARIYTCKSLTDTSEELAKFSMLDEIGVQIRNDLGDEEAEELSNKFKNDNVDILNLEGELGAGGDSGILFPVVSPIFIGLAIYAVVGVGKGFFDEFGRGLAKKLLSLLFDRKSNTQIMIYSKAREITLIVPADTNKKHFGYILEILQQYKWSEKNIKKLPNGTYLYSPDSRTLIKLSN